MNNDERPASENAASAGTMALWDRRTFEALRTRSHFQPMETLLKWLSIAGNWGLFWVGLAAAIWIAIGLTGAGATDGGDNIPHGQRVFILTIMFVYPTLLVNYIVKLIVKRKRPVSDDPRLRPLVQVPSSPSFPSSHAAMSFAAATAMTYTFPMLAPVFFLLALVMSFTRVYLGVHYPSDVLAGMAVGVVSSLFWIVGLDNLVL